MRLKNKIAVITGAGSGFGKGIAIRFAEEGAKVVIADINLDSAEKVAAEIGENALAFEGDVSQDRDVSSIFECTLKHFGVKSVFLTAKHGVPLMKKQGHGVILNVASTAGLRPRPGLAWYNTSKGAMITATKAMAIELATFKIRVNAINPVAGETGMLHLFMGEDTPEKRAQFVSSIPWGRLSQPEDMANAALFLCSDEADMVTGTCMEVDGGRCI